MSAATGPVPSRQQRLLGVVPERLIHYVVAGRVTAAPPRSQHAAQANKPEPTSASPPRKDRTSGRVSKHLRVRFGASTMRTPTSLAQDRIHVHASSVDPEIATSGTSPSQSTRAARSHWSCEQMPTAAAHFGHRESDGILVDLFGITASPGRVPRPGPGQAGGRPVSLSIRRGASSDPRLLAPILGRSSGMQRQERGGTSIDTATGVQRERGW